MNITSIAGDIIVKKEKNKNSYYLSQEFLLKNFSELSEEYLRIARHRYKQSVTPCFRNNAILLDTGHSWRFARFGHQFYYCYSNIPNKAPSYYRSQLPTEYELKEMIEDASRDQAQGTINDFIKEYLNDQYTGYLHAYGDCTPVQQTNLAKAAACIQACVDYINDQKINVSKNPFFVEMASCLAANDVKYIPHNFRCLKEKVQQAISGTPITEVIKLPRKENANRSRYFDEEIESWIIQLRDMGQNYTNAHIIRKIRQCCLLSQKPIPSDRWIGGVMERHNTRYLTATHRFGANGRMGYVYKGYLPFKNALFAGDCWQVDGTRVNILDFKHVFTNKQGEEVKKKVFLYIIAVRDVHSGDILGYTLSFSEDRWAVINAIKMAVKQTGYLPYQMVFDRFPGHNTPEFENFKTDLQTRGVNITITSKETGKAKLERWFNTAQTVFMQDSTWYYGEGIKSRRPYAHRSEEYLSQLRKQATADGWNFDAACAETDAIIEKYRTTRLCDYSRKFKRIEKTPIQLHADSEKPHVIPVEEHQFAYLFGLKKVVSLKHQGLIYTEVQSYPFYFRTTDYSIISRYKKVTICYDLEDMSHIHLYEISDKPLKQYLGAAVEEEPAQIYGPNPEFNKLGKREAIIKELNSQREQELSLKKAVGYDVVSMLTPRAVSKYDFEAAESNFLQNVSQEQQYDEDNTDRDVIDQL